MSSNNITQKYATGSTIDGKYEVLELLSCTEMSEVYKVKRLDFKKKENQIQVLKTLKATHDPRAVERFKNEIEVCLSLNKLKHPCIIEIFDSETRQDAETYFTMEFIPGETLASKIKSSPSGTIPLDQALRYLNQLAEVFDLIHRNGIVHRDIKPENIMIDNKNNIKLFDFGIVRDRELASNATVVGAIIGSHHYMAPEQWNPKNSAKQIPYDGRTDIYAFGIMAYELVTGQKPFDLEEIVQLQMAHLFNPVPLISETNKNIPQIYDDLVQKCTNKKPTERFQSGQEIRDFIRLHINDYIQGSLGSFLEGMVASTPLSDKYKKILYKTQRTIRGSIQYIIMYAFCFLISFANLSLFTELPYSLFVVNDSRDVDLLDSFIRGRKPRPVPDKIKLITINDATYESYNIYKGRIFPRGIFADLIEFIGQQKPDKIILDYMFADNAGSVLYDEKADNKLIEAFKKTNVYISKYLTVENNKSYWDESAEKFKTAASGIFYGSIMGEGVIRKFNLGAGTKGIPPIARIIYGENAAKMLHPDIFSFINYYGPPRSIEPIQFEDVLKTDKYKNDFFRDSIVVVGQVIRVGVGEQKRDTFLTPYGKSMSGVEIHATTAANILDKSWIKRLPEVYEGLIIFALTFLFTYLSFKFSAFVMAVVTAFSILAWVAVSYLLFRFNLFFPSYLLVMPLMPVLLVFKLLKELLQHVRRNRILGV